MFLLLGGLLCAIIGLVGVLNFSNAMMTGILSRRREFAVLQAVGMDEPAAQNHADLRGVVLRNVFRSGSLYSVAVGNLLQEKCWAVCSGSSEYRFTILPVLLTIPVFLLLGWLILHDV